MTTHDIHREIEKMKPKKGRGFVSLAVTSFQSRFHNIESQFFEGKTHVLEGNYVSWLDQIVHAADSHWHEVHDHNKNDNIATTPSAQQLASTMKGTTSGGEGAVVRGGSGYLKTNFVLVTQVIGWIFIISAISSTFLNPTGKWFRLEIKCIYIFILRQYYYLKKIMA